jgi:polyisoprenoid-binding protein YceI
MSTMIETQKTLPAGTWTADAAHSRVEFAVDYMVGTFRGSFSPFEATLEVRENGEAKLAGAARAENVKVQEENLTAHLQTADFFDAERAPELRFESTEIRSDGDELVVEGALTVRGATQRIELRGEVKDQITDSYGNERIGLSLRTTVDRTAFGITWNNPLPSGEPALANEVELSAELYLIKA